MSEMTLRTAPRHGTQPGGQKQARAGQCSPSCVVIVPEAVVAHLVILLALWAYGHEAGPTHIWQPDADVSDVLELEVDEQ